MKIKHTISTLANILLSTSFLLALATVFIINTQLAHGVVSGKYFWFYGSMGLVSIATIIHSIINKQSFRFSLTDGFVLLFAGSVFLRAWLFGDVSVNSTKLTLLVLLVVLYFCLRCMFLGIAGQARNDRKQEQGIAGRACNDRKQEQGIADLRYATLAMTVSFICFFIILTGLVEAVWGLLQLYGFKPSQHSLFHLTGSFFNPGPYAGYLAVVFPLALYLFKVQSFGFKVQTPTPETQNPKPETQNQSHVIKWFAGITCIAIILVLPAAMSRASWLAAIAGSAFVLITNYELEIRNFITHYQSRITRHLSRVAIILVAAFLIAAIFGMYYLKKDSADGRLLTWKVSLSVLAKHPLGVGLGHFPGAYGDAQAAYFASGAASETEEYVAGNPEYGFNEFLQIAIESGIVSLLLFTGMLACAFRSLAKARNWGVMGSLVALLVFACFSYPFSVLPFPIVFVFLLAMSGNGTRKGIVIAGAAQQRPAILRKVSILYFRGFRIKRGMTENKNRGFRVKRRMTWVKPAITLLCLFLTAFCLYKQYPVYEAYKQWNRQRMYYQAGMYKEAAQGYEPLYPCLNDRIQFLFEYGRSLSQWEQPEKSNEVLQRATKISCDPMLYNIIGQNYQKMQEYGLAEANLLKSTQIVPNRLYPWYLLMKLYVETGEEEKARRMAGIVLTKEPKVQSTAVREMREEAGRIRN